VLSKRSVFVVCVYVKRIFSQKLIYKFRYDTLEEFNVDCKAECGQLNLAHVTKTKKRYVLTNSQWYDQLNIDHLKSKT